MKPSLSIRLALEINGEHVCVADATGFGVLTAVVNWVKRDPARFDPVRLPQQTPENFAREELRVDVTGLDANVNPPHHQTWFGRTLNAGDVVTIRVLEKAP